jgi:hypothetical protein
MIGAVPATIHGYGGGRMIFYGSRGLTSTTDQGKFHCPRCGPGRQYELRQVRRWFTLYFIPLIPMNKTGEYVECKQCSGTFGPEAITYSPADAARKLLNQFRRALVLLVARAGSTDATRARLQAGLATAGFKSVGPDELQKELAQAASETGSLSKLLEGTNKVLTEEVMAILMVEGFKIIAGGGGFSASTEAVYREFAAALGFVGAAQDQMVEHLRKKFA